MPIEIKELHIKINVDENKAGNSNSMTVDQKKVTRLVHENIEQIINVQHRKKER